MKPGQQWTRADVRKLKRLVDDGYRDQYIALELGRSPRAVAIKRQRVGLTGRKLPRTSLREVDTDTLVQELQRRGLTVTRPVVPDIFKDSPLTAAGGML